MRYVAASEPPLPSSFARAQIWLYCGDGIIAIGDTHHTRNRIHPAPAAGALDIDDHVDCFGDQCFRDRHHGFLDQLFEPGESLAGAVGVDGPYPAGMARVPRIEQIQGFLPAHFADEDEIGAQAQGGTGNWLPVWEAREIFIAPVVGAANSLRGF